MTLEFEEATTGFLKKIILLCFTVILVTVTMPKRNKKVTDTGYKKTTTGKAKDRNSATASAAMDLNGSFLTPSGGTIVSTVSSPPPHPPNSVPTVGNDAVLAYLQRIDATNQALLKRVNDLESQRVNPTTVPATRATPEQGPSTGPTVPHLTQPGQQPSSVNSLTAPQAAYSQAASHSTGLPDPAVQITQNSHLHDAVIPDVNAIRANPTISQSVSQILSSLEAGSRAEAIQGKPTQKKSGRFNATDQVTAVPELRWPNEGFHGIGGRKRTLYDDLTIQEWAVGQLSNVYQIQNPLLVKQVLLQVILSLRDATSIPWQAVRSAWANSMQEVEQGSLQWSDATQWPINRLSTSQIAMANASQVSSQPTAQHKKVCRFYNEGVCSHEGNHGLFKHICAFCAKQGRSYVHPETKCQIKLRGGNKSQDNSK